jgi:hypothetical protein
MAETLSYRWNLSIARGTTIDAYLGADDVRELYTGWRSSWPEPFVFSGGEEAITCEMVLEVPEQELAEEYTKARARRILEAAKKNGGR